jgi:hypothetical protein
MNKFKLLIIILFLTNSNNIFGQKYCSKDTLFRWNNLKLFYLGFEVGSGIVANKKLPIDNFKQFTKFEMGLRIYLKKFVFGSRIGQLYTGDKEAGNVNNIVVAGEFINHFSTFYTGYMLTSPKYILIEPSIFYLLNRGFLQYDSLKYTNYSGNETERVYRIQSLGIGFNTYFNLYYLSPNLFSGFLPLYLYCQIAFQSPISMGSTKSGHLQNFSIGISMFPFFYKRGYEHF